MVGEIRDQETAEDGVPRARRRVTCSWSTLHNQFRGRRGCRVSATCRLTPILSPPRSSAVVGQRLVRQVCSACKVAYEPAVDLMREFFRRGRPVGMKFLQRQGFVSGAIRPGYRGPVSRVVELWTPNDQRTSCSSAKNAPLDEIRASAAASTLSMAGLRRGSGCREGRTNLEELISRCCRSKWAPRIPPQRHGASGHLEALEDLETLSAVV